LPQERGCGRIACGNDALAYWLEGVGWDKTSQLANTNLQAADIEDLLANNGYKPSASIRAIAFGPPRNVTSTFDSYAGHMRFNWVGRNVSFGCADGSTGRNIGCSSQRSPDP
jgi:hypothetical protein